MPPSVWLAARVTSPIEPWPRPTFQRTDRRASFLLLAFAGRDVLGDAPELELRGILPATAPVDAVDVSLIDRAENPTWFDGWRKDSLRAIATKFLDDLRELDAATHCYSVRVEVEDPPDLAHLQLGWAVASRLAQAGCATVLDAFAVTWRSGEEVAELDPRRPLTIQHEISLTAETDATAGFGHAVHTRGMIKFGRPDLIAGVSAERVQHTGRILNHLARMLAAGAMFPLGKRFRFDGERTLRVTPYEPDDVVPDVELNNDGLLLVDV